MHERSQGEENLDQEWGRRSRRVRRTGLMNGAGAGDPRALGRRVEIRGRRGNRQNRAAVDAYNTHLGVVEIKSVQIREIKSISWFFRLPNF
jgi:hypothetical protein